MTFEPVHLSGVPGTGKTNIISKLCCKKDSIVDVRYYAYEPIDPGKEYIPADVSRRVSADLFWDTLLNQLRDLLRGKLYKYRIPIRNDFLSLEEKRKEFFRIASEYACDEDRIFVIAVDGLDHAARAGCIEDTFLPTLPHPEYIPDNIKVLIAGQPKEDYPKYPSWLFQMSDDVKEYIIPEIQPIDILDLVENKCNELSAEYRKLIADIVCKYAEGNTLSAIFAVHEAMLSGNPIVLERNLQARRLSGNIQEYYRLIWEEAKRNIGATFVDYKIAGVFAFFNEPISADKLSQIFYEEGISKSRWKNILKALSPLLIEQSGYYTILHNDVRVYLSAFIGMDADHVQEVYSDLADYYISQITKTEGYYRDVIRFLIAANRGKEFEKVYSSKYVLSAYVNGVELNELKAITDSLLRLVISLEDLDWNKLRNLTLGYLTIDQIEKSEYEIEEASFRQHRENITVHPFECFVIPEKKWDYNVVRDVLQVVCTLYENDAIVRGRTLFHNWFSNMDFSRLESVVIGKGDSTQFIDLKPIAELLGRACVYVGEYDLLPKAKSESGHGNSFAFAAIEKAIFEIFNILDLELFSVAFDSIEILLLDPIIEGIKKLIDENRFEQLRRLEYSLSKRNPGNAAGMMLYTFLQIINGTASWTDAEADELWKHIKQIKMPDNHISNLMSYYTVYAVVSAYLQRKSRSAVANEVTERYSSEHKYKKSPYFLLYFNCACYLGKWIKARNTKKSFYDLVSDLVNILENLYHKAWSPNDTDFETYYLRAYILKGFILLARGEDSSFRSKFDKELEIIFANNPVNQLLDPGFMFFSNNPTRIQSWVDSWLAEGGRVWSEALGERNRIIKHIVTSVGRYDKNGVITFRGAEKIARWSVIGFASHKEYTVNILLNWYTALVDFNINSILAYGRLVKDMSDTIGMVGDNRFADTLNSKLYSDWGSLGVTCIQSILREPRYLSQCIEYPEYMVYILIGYLKYAELSRTQFLIIWGLGIGLLDWRNESDNATIYALQRAIELRASEMGILDIREDLFKIGPAYIDLVGDPMNRILDLRCDVSGDALDVINQYLDTKTEQIKTGDALRAIKSLVAQGKLDQDLSERIMNCEFQSADYGIYQNSILEYIVGMAKKQSINRAVIDYLFRKLESKYFYPAQDLSALITWRLSSEGEDFCRESVEALLDAYHCWITAADHIKAPEVQEKYSYFGSTDLMEADIFELYIKILLLIVRSEDADAARVALGGIFAVLQKDISYIKIVEAEWDEMHYRAKEWLLMVYELCHVLCPEARDELGDILLLHSRDNDFNVALYARILRETFYLSEDEEPECIEKDYFDKIPEYGTKRFIKIDSNTPWIIRYECVLKQIGLLAERLEQNLDDLEYRTAEYENQIEPMLELIPLYRQKKAGCKVICDNVNRSFFRVLYKDWYKGRWQGHEMDLARCILSASEPYYLVMSPQRWKWNNGKIFDVTRDLLKKTDEEKRIQIEKAFKEGIDTDEMVLAGSVFDYTYNQELFGYLLSFIDAPYYGPQRASCCYERNSRLLFLQRDDFLEARHLNVSLHYNGIESFKNSIISCGISKFALSIFRWTVVLGVEGAMLINRENAIIGRLEYYYGIRTDIGIRYSGDQPLLQRWVVKKDEVLKALTNAKCPYRIQNVVDFIVNEGNES